jgi:hypothetical protein
MKNKLTLLIMSLMLAGCGDTTYVDTHGDRIDDLERRADLNDAINELQNQLIQANNEAIAQEVSARIAGDNLLTALIDQENAARIAEDFELASSLAASIAAQSVVNVLVQIQIASIKSRFPAINSTLNSLQAQINNTNANLNALEVQINSLSASLTNLQLQQNALSGDLGLLQAQVADLILQVNARGVTVYACKRPDNSLSKERLFKIGDKFYGAMNYVSTASQQVITGSSSVTVSIPKLCRNKNNHDKTKLPNNGGQCTPANAWEVVPGSGTTQTIPAYTTGSTTVVTSVQIALEELLSGSNYTTTDGSAACTFNGNGTNLVPVQ